MTSPTATGPRRAGAALLAAALLLGGCGGTDADTGACDYLFGAPNEATGLDAAVCRPVKACGDGDPFAPPAYGPDVIAGLRARVPVDPLGPLAGDPYADPSLVPASTAGVCAVLADASIPGGYRLATFADAGAASEAGGVVTHTSACGACSSLQDLAVYLDTPDLGTPVRACALGAFGDPGETLSCILDLGFTEPCAQIWAANSAHTRESCLVECLEALDEPSHLPDGSLNACLACDEAQSGPVFKAVAGRTRRNSGIPSAICRPGEAVSEILHDRYP